MGTIAQVRPGGAGSRAGTSRRASRSAVGSAAPGRSISGSASPDDVAPRHVTPVHSASGHLPAGRVTPGRTAPSALALMESARQGLAAADSEVSAGARYVSAHLAALRAAAAVVAAKAEPPSTRRQRPQSVWALLPKVEPALAEWAAFFAAGAAKRAAAEAGLPRAVSMREADELLRDAETFVSLAEGALGILPQPLLPLASVG
jgi:SAV_6107-like HEPN